MDSDSESGESIHEESIRSRDGTTTLEEGDQEFSFITSSSGIPSFDQGIGRKNMDDTGGNNYISGLDDTIQPRVVTNKDSIKTAKIQRSTNKRPYVVRHIPMGKPTSIPNAANANKAPKSQIPNQSPLRIGQYMQMLLQFAGVDVANLDISLIEDRILQSTRADDETDAEHFIKVANAVKTFENIKTDHWKILMELTEAARRDLNEQNQHERYTRAIDIKEQKGAADVDISNTKNRLLLQELNEKEARVNKLESLSLLYDEYLLHKKLEAAAEYPRMSHIGFGAEDSNDVSSQRVQYIKEKCCYSDT